MPSDALSVLFLDIQSAFNGIDGGTGVIFSHRHCQLLQGEVGKFSYNLERMTNECFRTHYGGVKFIKRYRAQQFQLISRFMKYLICQYNFH